jgi:hypothetical protein
MANAVAKVNPSRLRELCRMHSHAPRRRPWFSSRQSRAASVGEFREFGSFGRVIRADLSL